MPASFHIISEFVFFAVLVIGALIIPRISSTRNRTMFIYFVATLLMVAFGVFMKTTSDVPQSVGMFIPVIICATAFWAINRRQPSDISIKTGPTEKKKKGGTM